MHQKYFKRSCTLCSAVAYCCGAVAPCAIAALLGRFLPRLGPLVYSGGPFFLNLSRERLDVCPDDADHSAADWNGSRSSSGIEASTSARIEKSFATCANRCPRARRRSSI